MDFRHNMMENMFIFGLTVEEVRNFEYNHNYDPFSCAARNPGLGRVLDQLSAGLSDGISYRDIVDSLLVGYNGAKPDPYFLLSDFDAYCQAQALMSQTYRNPAQWNAMSLENIAKAGFFAADRSIGEYAKNIWKV